MVFFADETMDVGYDSRTPVSPDYTPHGSQYAGKINRLQPDAGADDNNQFIDPEDRLRIVLARQ